MNGSPRSGTVPHFRKALHSRRFQDVVQQIQEAILEGRISNGAVLPSERELKERFSISRGTLREALRVLEDRGLLEIKIGNRGGTFVRRLTTEHASQSLALLIRSQVVSLRHLAQFRQSVEGDIAALAAQKATQDDLSQLTSLAESAQSLLRDRQADHAALYALDQRFHIELARITGNPVYLLVMNSIHANILKYYESFLEMGPEDKLENVGFFFDLIEAIRRGQVNEARILAESHVMQFGKKMRSIQRRSETTSERAAAPLQDTPSDKEDTEYDEPASHCPNSRE